MADLVKEQPGAAPRAIYLKDYRPPEFLVDEVSLRFELDPGTTHVFSRLLVRRNPQNELTDAPLTLQGKDLELVEVKLDGVQLGSEQYSLSEESLVLSELPDSATVEIETIIHPARNTALEGLYVSSGMFCTQCEAEGFRRITFFPDRPDVMSRYQTTIVADLQQYPVLLSNGNRTGQGNLDDGRHWVTWEDPFPKPGYLFALVAGDLACQKDSFTTRSGRKVDLRMYVEHENISKCDHALASLKQAMKWDEDTYGREYDLDIFMIVAVNDFNMGAMENKGLNIFNASCVLASPETATDADYYNIQSIIGHEYFHNWSGNRVTCRDWFQLSLKEGFTVFRDQEFSADLNSRAVKRIADVNILRSHQFAQDASPMAHPVRPDSYIEISNFYTVTVYNKGAEVVRMIRNLIGADSFRNGCDLYFSRHDGQAVTTDDFVQAMEDTSKVDLSRFRRWYSQAGTPVIEAKEHYDASDRSCILTLRQHCPATPGHENKQPFHIPVDIALLNPDGKPVPITDDNADHCMLELSESEQTFTFTNIDEKPVFSLLRGFSAPVKLEFDRSREELAFLFAHDPDPFNRWDAGQTLAIKVLLQLVDDQQNSRPLMLPDNFINAYRATLTDKTLDPALIAQAMSMPSESYLADQCESVDVDAVHTARQFVNKTLAENLYNELLQGYRQHDDHQPYTFSATCMAKRSLKNLCLTYLMETGSSEVKELCLNQLENARNMTDTMAALSALAQHDWPERQQQLERFYATWKHDPQVVEKWLSIQAGSRLPDTLKHVMQLMNHEAFQMTNPNKVRAVIGRFCMGNPVLFHCKDGSGYRFLVDQVLALDKINPQIAARLISALSRWKRFDKDRQQRMQDELKRVISTEGLSRDVFEIVSKSLDQ